MTPTALRSLVRDSYGGSYLYAAQQEADIADQYEGLGDPELEEMSRYHRAVSKEVLALAISLTTFHKE